MSLVTDSRRSSPHTSPLSVGAIGRKSRRGLTSVAFLVMLAIAETASADVVTLALSDFLVFSGGGTGGTDGGYETDLSGASLYIGNVGSNQDLTTGASETQILGSVYVGGEFQMQAPGEIGTDGLSSFNLEPPLGNTPGVYAPLNVQVIANTGDFENSDALIYGTLDMAGGYASGSGTPTVSGAVTTGATADTFGGITLAQTSFAGFTETQGDKLCVTTCTIDPNTLTTAYGLLDTTQEDAVYLRDGTYYFESINTSGQLDLYIDLTNGPVTIYVRDDATFGQETELWVKGAGTNGQYVLISDASQLAALINWQIGGQFNLSGGPDDGTWGSVFGGYVYSSKNGGTSSGSGIYMEQRIDWYGALWAYDSIFLLDHSRYTYVPAYVPNGVPEPAGLLLLGVGLLGVAARVRMKSRR